jgi:hypothetical protein
MSNENSDTNDLLKVKIYPVPFKNRMGFRIGNINTVLNKKVLPFKSTDQVDHFLYNFFNYLKYEGGPKDERSIDDRKNAIAKFFKNHEEKVYSYVPLTDPPTVKKGGKSNKYKRSTKKHVSAKNRTRKNRK